MSSGRPIFLTLEGLRGCGKSTIAPLLAQKLDARLLPTIPEEFNSSRALLDNESHDAQARAYFFASAVLLTAERVRALIQAGDSVVVDSFLARTIATHRAYGAEIDPVLPTDWLHPDIVYLTCSHAERVARLQSRPKRPTWWDHLADARADAIEREYDRFAMCRIETTGRRPQETVEDILAEVYPIGVRS